MTRPTASSARTWQRAAAIVAALVMALVTLAPSPAHAQDDPDLDINLSQPDFTIITLPTTLRVPRFKSAFRVTHRFTRPLGQGDFGDLAEDFFGIDSGAAIGLEYRFGLMRKLQVGIHRTNDRTIQFFTRVQPLAAARRSAGRRQRHRLRRRHEQLPRQLLARAWSRHLA